MRMMTAMTMMTLRMMLMMMETVVIIAKSLLDLLDLLRGRLSRVGACVQGLGQVRLARHGGGRVVKGAGSGAGSRAVVWQDVQRAASCELEPVFNEPQLRELSGLWTMWVGLVSYQGQDCHIQVLWMIYNQ